MRLEPAPDPKARTSPGRARAARQSGFALIAALALLVVLSSTAAMMIRLSGIQQAGSSIGILGARAQWAAESGVEWALAEAIRSGGCPSPLSTLDLGEAALTGFRLVVECSASSHFEGDDERISLRIRSRASSGLLGGRDYVFREVHAAGVL